jgi:undecaprenyl diphosphate synthase
MPGLNFQIAINYGSRDEIVRAVKQIAGKIAQDSTLEIITSAYEQISEKSDKTLNKKEISSQKINEIFESKVKEIDEEMISRYLDTHEIPDPDLLIRTSGELRLSNFLLWQLAYTEFYFTEVPWPAFDKKELVKAIEKYNERDRRFGAV